MHTSAVTLHVGTCVVNFYNFRIVGPPRSVCKDYVLPLSPFLFSISLSPSLSLLSLHFCSLSLLSLSLLSLSLLSLPDSIIPKVISLRKCGISDPPTNYYLAEVVDAARNERELQPSECPYDLKQIGYYGPLKLYIRARVS